MTDLFTPAQAQDRHPILAFFARRPVTIMVLLVATAVLGMISTRLMPMELIPAGIEGKSLSVEIEYSRSGGDASPMVVEREVTLPVEAELSTIPGVKDLSAASRSSGSRFGLTFDKDRNMDEAYAEVWAAIERARLRLPDGVGRIQVRREQWDSSQIPVVFATFAWEDGTVDPYLKLEQVVQPYLESIEGVSSVTFDGTLRKFLVVDIDPEKSRAYNINLAQLLQRLRADNFRAPAGKVTVEEGSGGTLKQERDVYLVADSRFTSIEEIENLPVRAGITLADITRHGVGDDGQPHRGVYETYSRSQYVHVNRKDGVTGRLMKTGDANTVEVGDRIVAALEELKSKPGMEGFDIRVSWNQGESIQESIDNLLQTLLWGGVLAVFVLMVFLKSWRLSLMIALSIPLSMTMALAIMYFNGDTINLMVLMGFTLGAGMLLDNSIVVAENVFRRHSLGEEPYAAAVRGAGEVGLALVLATSTTVIVFVTTVVMLDNETLSFYMGKIGLPVCLSIGFSIAVAIGVTPMTMFRAGLLKPDQKDPVRTWFVRLGGRLRARFARGGLARLTALPGVLAWEAGALFIGRNPRGIPATPVMDVLVRWYGAVVRVTMPARYWLTVVLLAGTFGVTYWLFFSQPLTDQNQGNRESISLRMGFDDGSDIMVSKRALQITGIAPGSAAEKGRLKLGDYVLRYNNRRVESLEDLRRLEQSVPAGSPIRVDLARGKQTGYLEIAGGPTGIDGEMQDTDPLRDAIWTSYVFDVEDILLGRQDAAAKRAHAMAQGMPEAEAQLAFGRTPEEAREWFGIQDMSVGFSAGRANFWIYIDPDRVSESGEFYKRMTEAMPERAGVEVRGEFTGGSTTSEVSVQINGPETEKLMQIAQEVIVRLSSVEGLEGLRIDADEGMDEVTVGIDRQRAIAYGVEPGTLSQVIGFQLSGTSLRDYHHGEILLPLRVRFAPPEDESGNPRDPGLADVSETRVVAGQGGSVAAKAVTTTSGVARSSTGDIRRMNRKTSLRVVGTTSTEDLERIQSQVRTAMEGVKFPPGYDQQFGGRFANFDEGYSDLGWSLVASIVLVFLVMCFLFESFLKPVCILFASIPGAIMGGFGLLRLTGTPIDMFSMLGLMVLVGVVVNNGIVMVDLINRLRGEGMDRKVAVETAARQRLRPILLTSLTTIFGLIPMAVGSARFVGMPYYPLGRLVLGGMIVSMCYTLVLVPLLYTILDDVGAAVKSWIVIVIGKRAKGGGEVAAVPASAE